MPYDQDLAFRIKKIVSDWDDMTEKKMFGGVCQFLHGHIVCGVYKDNLVARVGVKNYFDSLQKKHVLPFDITGRPMKGWVMIAPTGITSEKKLKLWIHKAREFVETLPPKY